MIVLSFFDIFILFICVVSSCVCVYRGLINVVIGLLGFVASIFVSMFFYPYIQDFFCVYIENRLLLSIVSGFVAYVVSLIIFTYLVSKAMVLFSFASKGCVDRGLGLLFGFFCGAFISTLLFFVIVVFSSGAYYDSKMKGGVAYKISSEKYPSWLRGSVFVPFLEESLRLGGGALPLDVLLQSILAPKKDIYGDEDVIDVINRSKNRFVE